MLVPHQLRQLRMRPPHRRLHSFLSNPNPHRQRIHERPHRPIRSFPSLHSSEQHRPKHHILSSRHLPHHLRPRHVEYAGRAHPQFPRPFSHTRRQLHIHSHPRFFDSRPIPPHIQQPKRRRRLFHIPQQPFEIPLVFFPTHSQSRLPHQVPELSRCRQSIFLAQQIRFDFLLHHLHRAVISSQVMQQLHQQPSILLRVV